MEGDSTANHGLHLISVPDANNLPKPSYDLVASNIMEPKKKRSKDESIFVGKLGFLEQLAVQRNGKMQLPRNLSHSDKLKIVNNLLVCNDNILY